MTPAIHHIAHLPMTDEQSRLAAGVAHSVRSALLDAYHEARRNGLVVLTADIARMQSEWAAIMLDHGDDSIGDTAIAQIVLREARGE